LQGLLDRWFIGSVANGKLTKHGQTPFDRPPSDRPVLYGRCEQAIITIST